MPFKFVIADRATHNELEKTYKGEPVMLVAVQKNRRVDRKGKDSFIFRIGRDVYYNHDISHNWFIPMARTKDDMSKYRAIFCVDSPTPQATAWLAMNDYTLV